MPDKPIKKGFDILKEVEEISKKPQTGQPHKEFIDLRARHLTYELRVQLHTAVPKYFASNIWSELLLKTREFPKHEFKDDISELRQEVDSLKLIVGSLTKTIGELSEEIRQRQTIRQTIETSIHNLCDAYTEMVSKIEIVKKIYIVDTTKGLACWTIVDTEPFDSTLLEPIYDAQVKIYRQMESTAALDFHVLNLSEFDHRPELESVLPPSAKLVWQR